MAQIDLSESMTRAEKRAASGLAAIFGLRMLGMFLILPVFALYAEHLPGGDNHTLVGLALGMYGLTQAMLMIPFGMASDRIGRKKVIIFGLIVFALGSFLAATATDIYWTIVGRALQGAGAISAAVTAMLADLTREEHRTKAMALIGSTIGIAFAVSLVAGPALNRVIGVPGIFALTGVLALAAIWVVKVVGARSRRQPLSCRRPGQPGQADRCAAKRPARCGSISAFSPCTRRRWRCSWWCRWR